MIPLNLICRLCLTNVESDSSKILIKLTYAQKKKFEDLTQINVII